MGMQSRKMRYNRFYLLQPCKHQHCCVQRLNNITSAETCCLRWRSGDVSEGASIKRKC